MAVNPAAEKVVAGPLFWSLGIEIWDLFEFWCLLFVIYYFRLASIAPYTQIHFTVCQALLSHPSMLIAISQLPAGY